jgi:hypothetical protein
MGLILKLSQYLPDSLLISFIMDSKMFEILKRRANKLEGVGTSILFSSKEKPPRSKVKSNSRKMFKGHGTFYDTLVISWKETRKPTTRNKRSRSRDTL